MVGALWNNETMWLLHLWVYFVGRFSLYFGHSHNHILIGEPGFGELQAVASGHSCGVWQGLVFVGIPF
jgi:hypothetical protein